MAVCSVASAGVAAKVVALLLLGSGTAFCQVVRDDFPMTNGPVHAIASAGNTIYIGGEFTRVGPPVGSAAFVSSDRGELLSYPDVHGWTYAVAADGARGCC